MNEDSYRIPGIPLKRCQVHLQRNTTSYVPKKELLPEAAPNLRTIFRATDINDANRLLNIAFAKYSKSESKLHDWMEKTSRTDSPSSVSQKNTDDNLHPQTLRRLSTKL